MLTSVYWKTITTSSNKNITSSKTIGEVHKIKRSNEILHADDSKNIIRPDELHEKL